MSSKRTVSRAISEGNIKDLLIPFLYQLGYLEYGDELLGMDLGPWKDFGDVTKNGRGTLPLTLRIKSINNDEIMEKAFKKNGGT